MKRKAWPTRTPSCSCAVVVCLPPRQPPWPARMRKQGWRGSSRGSCVGAAEDALFLNHPIVIYHVFDDGSLVVVLLEEGDALAGGGGVEEDAVRGVGRWGWDIAPT